ncbi:hypothetical protein FF38_03910 [Lucilia cuprina]|uniref:Zinc carboxypeptidase A 1 n=1 Tax=Lucilia cuprina TaxID=7375 RepID=A0A0L0CD26_LUCCU|nr:hypothetical protein FF38_03910 [Lucilia cuprina]
MKVLLVLIGFSSLLAVSSANQFAARYDDFKVYRVKIKDEQQLKEFIKLCDNLPLRYLNELQGPGHSYDVVIDPANQNKLETQLRFLELEFSCMIEDLQSVLEEECQPETRQTLQRKRADMDWTQYHDLPVIYSWLQKITSKHRRLVKPYVIGRSYEKRPIKAIKISAKPGNKAIFVESNIHAIEWISSATTTCFFENLLNSEDPQMKNLLENYDWLFVPVLNPDGFEYSHNVERLWRKNRRPTGFHNASGPCYGIDMNRNFGYGWGISGYNFDVPCDHWYGGAKPDSEPEVQALERFVNSFEDGYIRMYLAFHSFGNYVLLPYGHTNAEFPPNYDQMMRIATAFADAARVKYGTDFKSGASGLLNYPVSGSAKDWAYGVKKIPFTATIELRDRGRYGFFLPPSQIGEVCEEVTDGLVAMYELVAVLETQFEQKANFEDDMKLLLIVVGFLGLLAVSSANQFAARYDDFKVYRVNVKDAQQFGEFMKLGNNLPAQTRSMQRTHVEMDWTQYHDLPVIYNWLQKLNANNPKLVKSYVIANAFADGARVKYGTDFLSGASGLLNYPVSGSAKDWAYGVKKIPFTATVELRDRGQYGFFLPPSQIVEVLLRFITRKMLRRGYIRPLVALVLLANLALAAVVAPKDQVEQPMRYDNYKVYKVKIDNVEQYNQVMALEGELELDFWNEVHNFGESFDVMVKPDLQQKFEEILLKSNMVYEIKIQNVQSLIDNEQPKTRSSTGMDWENFHTLDEIYEWLDMIVERYPDIVTPFDIGYSYEGRLIKGIKISYKPGNKAVFIESNIHAREWITSATITYIIDELLVPRNPGVRKIAESVDWWIIPVLNVDGFVYSHEVNRMWRKSRLPSDPTGKCIGTDLNRNFDFLWMLTGASSDPCSETYAGPSAESDQEIKQMLQFINNTIPEDTIKIYISLHSYGQYVLSPWGHTDTEFPEHYDQMMHVAKGYADALYRRYKTVFTYGSSATTLYKVSGSGKEWAYGVKGIPIPYTIELRDKGEYGFVLPPEMILPVAKEVLDGFVGMINAAQEINIV